MQCSRDCAGSLVDSVALDYAGAAAATKHPGEVHGVRPDAGVTSPIRFGPELMPRQDATLDSELEADRARAVSMNHVSRETWARLDSYVALLRRWQRTTNLVAPSTLPQLWTRHVADSLQLVPLAPDARIWIDLGSGGGFPGLVVACVLAEREGAEVHLVESNDKKAAFLREVGRAVRLPVTVHAMRIEEFVPAWSRAADVVSARALAPLSDLLGFVAPLVNKGAKALLMKGQDVGSELTESAKYWTLDSELVPSTTDTRGQILIVTHAERRRGGS